ncbi:MAG TPA: cytochrome c, partial [Anaerolineales bacterium]|nr:cytochrome c [Anaerolineales bacterium]
TMDQTMPMLSVAAPAAVAAAKPPVEETKPVTSATSPTIYVSLAVLGLGLVGAVIGFRQRSRPILAVTALCLLVGTVLLIAGAGTASEAEAQSKSESAAEAAPAAKDATLSQVEFGRQLFIAKGCITCHYNSKAASASEYWTIEMGATNLSNFSADPQVLFVRLEDPSAAKSDTQMPNLDLTREEIEALIAFINSR